MSKTKTTIIALVAFLAGGILALAQPKVNTSKAAHPNLNAAQKFCLQAYDKLSAAQTANEYDMKGHAAKAKQLLDQVNNEIKQAADAANRK
jgi:hypothetical protein